MSELGTVLREADRDALLGLLAQAQALGFLGPGPLEAQIDRSLAFTHAVAPPERAVDLGSGGGLPGLVLALAWPDTTWVLIDAHRRRCAFLERALLELELGSRAVVVCERAEVTGRGTRRSTQDLVVARGFGPPAVTAECAAPLLRPGGRLLVAEPPGGAPERWPEAGLAALGLRREGRLVEPVAIQILRQVSPCPGRFPRRVGTPAKRPLFA
jgi:16S rRNA (guanine527-N7)-methyltransferase